MGTGKSVVGRLLAKKLRRPFLDLDERIERQAGRSIAELFATEGEAGFRKRETHVVQKVAALKNHIIATGGGVMLNEDNVRALKRSGLLVCLTASPEMIFERTSASVHARPLLRGPDPRSRIEELLKLRTASYAQVDIAIDSSKRSVQEVAEEILKFLSK